MTDSVVAVKPKNQVCLFGVRNGWVSIKVKRKTTCRVGGWPSAVADFTSNSNVNINMPY